MLCLPGLKKVVHGLGQRRGVGSEFSPGMPFMWRKVEMRLACTATRLPPTPAERHTGLRSGVGRAGRKPPYSLLSAEALPSAFIRVDADIALALVPGEQNVTEEDKYFTTS